MSKKKFPCRLEIRTDEEFFKRLNFLAEKNKLSKSEIIRFLVDTAYQAEKLEHGGDTTTPPHGDQ